MQHLLNLDKLGTARAISSNNYTAPAIAFTVAFLILFLRRPEALLNAQFWAEDGAIWFSQAFNQGFFSPLFSPQDGYFQTISRLTMGIASLFPLEMAPFVSNLIGLIIRCLPVCFLFTPRMGWVGPKEKVVISVYYLLMPGIWEVHPNITNAHWYLSLYLCMIIAANLPNNLLAKAHDIIVLVIAGLSGPFIVFIAPLYGLKYLAENNYNLIKAMKEFLFTCNFYRKLFNIFFIAICLIQIASIFLFSSGRSPAPLGLTPEVLFNILSARVFLGSFLPPEAIHHVWQMAWLNLFVTLISCGLLSYVLLKGGWRMAIFIGFSALMIGFALAKPMISLDQAQLPILINGNVGGRYFIVTNIVWVACLVFIISRQRVLLKNIFYSLLLCVIAVSSYHSFSVDNLQDFEYQKYVKQYYELPEGETIDIPLNPGGGWSATLIKKKE
ncbi:glucosyl transferase [Vreelandella populi]|uniref:Glucosyl transferase n=1 Tax=Vreelandella populi TaxID=2498858 RepID=A0A433LBH3_9GAMM|nr:glucosyl transferase [Halomonas populi]RUR42376.1 glucosyl transferase [Halomonas populi]RUR46019.1 glucosyl transferase [Halomonas populi]RUR57997.1 glucosyl transferase [Halomonas populi]